MGADPTGGRAELERLLAGHTARTQQLASRVAVAVAAAVARGDDPTIAVNASMESLGVALAVRETVATAVVQSVCVGYGIWPSVRAADPADLTRWKATALANPWDGSGMPLSSRLHGTDAAMRADIVDAVKANVSASKSAWDAQRQIYDGYGMGGAIRQAKLTELPKDLQALVDKAGKVLSPEDLAQLKVDAARLRVYAERLATAPLRAAYEQMARRLEKGLTDGLDALVRTATEEKARYHASRILRTEAARAWGQGFHAECMDDTDCVGIKWNLSSSHKIFDICDFNHQADLYGMGPGVYPKAKWPRYPAHPHCQCPQRKVFVGRVPPERDNVEAGGKAALDGMTESQRARLLTRSGLQGFKGGAGWKGDLRNYDGAVTSGMSPGARAVIEGVKQWQPPLEFAQGAEAVLAQVQASSGPKLERKASEAIARVDQIIRRADALEKGGRPVTGARAATIQKSIEKALAVEYPAKITATSGALTAEQADGMTRLSEILSARAVPNGVEFSALQINPTQISGHSSRTATSMALGQGQPLPLGWEVDRIKIRTDAKPGIMAHELMHAADDQSKGLFDALMRQNASGSVRDDWQWKDDGILRSPGYANTLYRWGQTEYLTRGAEHIIERAMLFRKEEPEWFKRSVELLRGEWNPR